MRSATWDGTADTSGAVTQNSVKIYQALATGGIGLIVTGYSFVSLPGQANSGQYGIYNDKMIPGWKAVVKKNPQERRQNRDADCSRRGQFALPHI